MRLSLRKGIRGICTNLSSAEILASGSRPHPAAVVQKTPYGLIRCVPRRLTFAAGSGNGDMPHCDTEQLWTWDSVEAVAVGLAMLKTQHVLGACDRCGRRNPEDGRWKTGGSEVDCLLVSVMEAVCWVLDSRFAR